ncbi:heme ABC exporter ATP-binding protein CcmA [Marinicella gelatinilytica]|uniref:heme ABC exporter ATP-binding protein CcmA n=1 Tax=Marinicella gelatinilytica TaxID=2996017 RepID=UPI00226089A4|nr:heme ABC exporter ATP-binding protein CcmA [Marinicella gelatinilytica]MCX7543958.1 heme ABC exporter ATP-binding protein CcmA [Marinicella gelatinilytica]
MQSTILHISRAQCQKGGEPLFAPIDLTLKPGQMAVVAGNNGSGKTTLLEAVACLGVFSYGGINFAPYDNQEKWLLHSHYIGHSLGNKANLSCLENLKFAAAINGIKVRERQLSETLDSVGLRGYEYQFASDLSAGQKKRLALGRLLLLNKQFWLLDEPFVNLDTTGCDWLFTCISDHINNGGAALLTAHDNKRIHEKADHLIQLERP